MQQELLQALQPICAHIAALDLSNPASATADLTKRFGDLKALRAMVLAAEGLTPREAGPDVRFGRLARPGPDTAGLSIDAVEMEGAAAEHIHPNGEVSLCFAVDGDPTFMGSPEGWVVAAPGSQHVPTVAGGRMRILYFLPQGAMTWV